MGIKELPQNTIERLTKRNLILIDEKEKLRNVIKEIIESNTVDSDYYRDLLDEVLEETL